MDSPETLDAVIVGAGFAGIYQLHKLREAGFNVHLYDAADEPGGIWYWNCYPGARVDSEVPVYQLSVEKLWREWNWSERFPNWSEVREYFRFAVDRLELQPHMTMGTRIEGGEFDEDKNLWTVRSSKGKQISCRYLILCTGFAAKPFVPAFPGLDNYKGVCPHTGQWPQAGLDFTDKHVGVVGSGASAIQVIQQAAKTAKSLTVYQRSPTLALPMDQKKLTVEEQEEAKPGYPEMFKHRLKTFGGYLASWKEESLLALSPEEQEERLEAIWNGVGLNFWVGNYLEMLVDEKANDIVYDYWRRKTVSRINDPAVAEILAPRIKPHPIGTKRLSLEQGFYEVFNQDNVSLINLKENPIENITGKTVSTALGDNDLDILVMGTGFDAVSGGILKIDLRGRNGSTLNERWKEGVKTYLGISSAEFPNMFFHYGPQAPSGFSNGPSSIEVQVDWLTRCLKYLRENNLECIEAQHKAEQEWGDHCSDVVNATLFPKADTWYMGANIPGKPRQILNYPGGIPMYSKSCEESAAKGYEGFKLT